MMCYSVAAPKGDVSLDNCFLGEVPTLWNGRRAVSSPFFIEESKLCHVLTHQTSVDVLGKHISWILRTKDLLQLEVLLSDPVLDPEISRG